MLLDDIREKINDLYWSGVTSLNIRLLIEETFEKPVNQKFKKGEYVEYFLESKLMYYPFNLKRYYIKDLFLFKYKNKEYILGVFEHHRQSWLKCQIKRYYPSGEVPRRRRNVSKVKVKSNTAPSNLSVSNDCQIRTLSTLTGAPYVEILEKMRSLGWNNLAEKTIGHVETKYNGVVRWDKVLSDYGLKKTLVWKKDKWSGEVVGHTNTPLDRAGTSVKTAVKTLKSGRYVIYISGHVCALYDGQLYDDGNCSNCHVLKIFKIEENA